MGHAGSNGPTGNGKRERSTDTPSRRRASTRNHAPVPIDGARLRALALAYAARYATSRERLRAYLARRVARSGWDEHSGDPGTAIAVLVDEFAEKAYVDDQAYALGRASSMRRRGYGARRIGAALKSAGIDPDQQAIVLGEATERDTLEAAHRYARRRRFGPYAPQPIDAAARRRAIAAMLRAGHEFEAILKVLDTRDDPDFPGTGTVGI